MVLCSKLSSIDNYMSDLSLNVILLPGCFLKTLIDIMLVTLLFYILTFLFLSVSSSICRHFITRSASCHYVAAC